MAKKSLKILSYVDDTALITGNKEDLQGPLFRKSPSLVISKESIRCKLTMDEKTITQVMKFNYFSPQIFNTKNLNEELRANIMKASRVSKYVN